VTTIISGGPPVVINGHPAVQISVAHAGAQGPPGPPGPAVDWTVDVRDHAAVGDGSTDNTGFIGNADTAAVAADAGLLVARGTYRVNSNLTVASPLVFVPGGVLKPASGVTVTLIGHVDAGPYQIFDLSLGGTVKFASDTTNIPPTAKSKMRVCLVEWWGAVGDDSFDSTSALAAAIAGTPAYGILELGPNRSYWATPDNLTINKPMWLRGGGRFSTRLRALSGTGWLLKLSRIVGFDYANHSYGIQISDLMLEGNGRSPDCGGLHMFLGGHFSIVNVQVDNFQRSALWIEAVTQEGRFENFYARHCGNQTYPQINLSPDGFNGPNNLHFDGLFSEFPVGDGLRISPINLTAPLRGIFINNFLLHGPTGTVTLGDGNVNHTNDIHSYSCRNLVVRDARGVFLSNGRIHASGRGQPNILVANRTDGAAINSLHLSNVYVGVGGATFSATCTAATTDIITCTGSMLSVGALVRFTTTGTLPAGLSLATDYYGIGIDNDTFKVASTLQNAFAGTAVDITGTGTGTHTVTCQNPNMVVDKGDVSLTSVRMDETVVGSRAHMLVNAGATVRIDATCTFGSTIEEGAGTVVQGTTVEFGTFAARPVNGVVGSLYIATDTGDHYFWSGTAWVLVGTQWELHAEWTIAGTFSDVTLPPGTKTAKWVVVAGGGGGGSGRKGPGGANRFGGGAGGAGGMIVQEVFSSAALTDTYTVVVGAGGTGGASVSANGTDGNAGGNGGGSTVTGAVVGLIARAAGAGGGSGGTATTGTAGTSRTGFEGFAGAGGAGSSGVGANATGSHQAPSGGGGGGGVGSGGVASAGGSGGVVNNIGTTGAAGGAVNTVGTVGVAPTAEQRQNLAAGGGGGGGGGASSTTNAGAGGAGGFPGAGGGGGGAAVDAVGNSGAGGDGGIGYVAVWVLVPA